MSFDDEIKPSRLRAYRERRLNMPPLSASGDDGTDKRRPARLRSAKEASPDQRKPPPVPPHFEDELTDTLSEADAFSGDASPNEDRLADDDLAAEGEFPNEEASNGQHAPDDLGVVEDMPVDDGNVATAEISSADAEPHGMSDENPASRDAAHRVDVMRAFRAQIEPHLSKISALRRRAWISTVIAILVVGLGVFVGARIFGAWLGLPGTDWAALALAVVIGGPIGYVFGDWIYARRLRKKLLPLLCDAIGGVNYRGGKRRGFKFSTFNRLGLIDRRLKLRHLEDRFTGTYRNTNFDMMEAVYRASNRRDDPTRRFFRGLLIRLSVPMPFDGTTIVTARGDGAAPARITSFFSKRRLKPVPFDDPVFDLHYKAVSDNADEARRLVAPVLRNALLAMSNERQGEIVRAAFHKGDFWISVPVWKPLFEIASLMTPARMLEERTLRAADEITVAHRIIDQLHGSGPKRLI